MNNSKIIEFNKYPFLMGLLDRPDFYDKYCLPENIPISLSYNSQLNLIEHNYSPETKLILEKSYKIGKNISSNLGAGSFGQRRAEDVLKSILVAFNNDFTLEIGCADGYILNQLSLLGAKKLVGCELESLSNNFHKLIYWDPSLFELTKEGDSYFKIFHSLGMLHYYPESLSKKLSEIYDDLLGWWSQKEIRTACNDFSNDFVLKNSNYIEDWKLLFSNL